MGLIVFRVGIEYVTVKNRNEIVTVLEIEFGLLLFRVSKCV